MQYYSHLTNYNVPKNQLQKDAVKVLEELDGFVIADKDKFIGKLRECIEALNEQYKRCIPLIIHTWDTYKQGIGISFGEVWTCNLYLFKVKEVHNG